MLNLIDEQVKLEQNISDEAVARYNKDTLESRDNDEWSSSTVGSAFVQKVIDHQGYTKAISEFIETGYTRKAGKALYTAKLLAKSGLEPEVIAYLATKIILNHVSRPNRLKRASLCMYIGKHINVELSVRNYGDSSPQRKTLLKKLFKDFDKRTYPKQWRIRTVKNYVDAEGLEWNNWQHKECLAVGYVLLALFQQTTGLIEISPDECSVGPSQVLMDKINEFAKTGVSLFTLYKPMVVPPIPWSNDNLFKGGYLTTKVRRYPLIKGSKKRDVERLSKLDLSKVITAVNALQETPWRVNRRMLEAQKWVYHKYGKTVGSIISSEEEPMPPKPEHYDDDPEVRKQHNRICFEVYDRRRQAKSKRISVVVTHAIADECAQYDAIYFPHNLCSRGRAYPLPAFLNPQGADFTKALLEFSVGKPVGKEDDKWLCIAGANAYGYDKVSLEERVKWVSDNEEMILSCAENYQHDHRWMQASEPYQFLRFCFEWQEFTSDPDGHLSHMVIPVDATNSGLQHYSAMLRDEVGGKSVNLIPGYARQDIYGDVAQKVIEKLVEDGSPMAKDWIAFGIDRKITKRQVMVVPYAGKFSSCLSYTREAVTDKLMTGVKAPWGNDPKEFNARTIYLAKLIWWAIDETVVKGKIAMQWLSKIASEWSKAANKQGLPLYDRRMSWLTPDGFEVVHFREDEDMHRIKTNFEGSVYLSYYRANGKLSVSDMALACPPNFVHALDATHLRMTVCKALDIGITDFGMVHDSFGVHASNMTQFLNQCVKPAFVEMYAEHDVIQEFADRFKDQSVLLETPSKGSLGLEGILQSEFFFS